MPVQRGFAMIAILALVALISAFLIASVLNRTAADVSNEREDRSMSALRKAKAALIAYAASEQSQLYYTPGTYFQPGALPCPDRDDNGTADCLLPNTASLIGRVPYKTMGLEDLRDASGERLWYALSHDFRKLPCTSIPALPTPPSPSGCTMINSDTKGQLTVVGTAPATQVVAILFAPGEALQGQNRDPANASAHNNPVNYLEGPPNLSDPVNYVFTTASPSATFNDRVLVITRAELMDAVEPVVAANIERDVKPLLTDYFGVFNHYPFPVPFVSPPLVQSAYVGASPKTSGLLPVTNTPFTWSATVTQIANFALTTVDSWSCTPGALNMTCIVHYTDGPNSNNARPVIKLEVSLSPDINNAFADQVPTPTPPGDIPFVMRKRNGNLAQYSGPPWGYWSFSGPPPTTVITGSVITYTGWLHDANDNNNQVTITFPLPNVAYLPRLTNPSTAAKNIDWFISNQWYRQTYYAVAPKLVPNGGGDKCATSPPCLTVKNLPVPNNNKDAILVFAGRALDGQNHPSANPKDYLEGDNCNLLAGKDLDTPVATPPTCNLSANDLLFEHRVGPSPTINDRVVVVAP